MDIKKEFESEIYDLETKKLITTEQRNTAWTWYFYGAKRAEELLLSDPLVVDLRKVWENAPSDADRVRIQFYEYRNEASKWIFDIPRPKPAWVPNKGDKVCWMLEGDHFIGYGVFQKASDNGLYFIESNRSGVAVPKDRVKPVTMENIGKRWEDIV